MLTFIGALVLVIMLSALGAAIQRYIMCSDKYILPLFVNHNTPYKRDLQRVPNSFFSLPAETENNPHVTIFVFDHPGLTAGESKLKTFQENDQPDTHCCQFDKARQKFPNESYHKYKAAFQQREYWSKMANEVSPTVRKACNMKRCDAREKLLYLVRLKNFAKEGGFLDEKDLRQIKRRLH